MNHFEDRFAHVAAELMAHPRNWVITGAAGFIGSHLVETLLSLDQTVVGLDNFSTGHQRNLDDVRRRVKPVQWARFKLIEGDIRDRADCDRLFAERGLSSHFVLHHAALGSVPESMADPLATNAINVDGFLNVLTAARDVKAARFIYAASSATYGDDTSLPKVESRIGKPLSPYALTKYINELYADIFARCYGFNTIGLRYFNVFGRRQDPDGPYAAVIPLWIRSLLRGESVFINGDGETTRDFCPVANVVQCNLLAAMAPPLAANQVYNVALGGRMSLNELFATLKKELVAHGVPQETSAQHRPFRPGDIKYSQADISKARELLGYEPRVNVAGGIAEAIDWYQD